MCINFYGIFCRKVDVYIKLCMKKGCLFIFLKRCSMYVIKSFIYLFYIGIFFILEQWISLKEQMDEIDEVVKEFLQSLVLFSVLCGFKFYKWQYFYGEYVLILY